MSLGFAYDTRFLRSGKQLHFRKGVWNTIDGVIDESTIENLDLFLKTMEKLQSGNLIDKDELYIFSEKDRKHFNDLLSMDFIIENLFVTQDRAVKVLTGQNYFIKNEKNEYTLITDSDFIEENIQKFSSTYNYTFNRINEDELKKLFDINLFSKVNSLDYEKMKSDCEAKFSKAPILVLLSNMNIPLLKNLNQIASKEKPLFVGFLDGPFMIFLSVIPKVTACWECFEQRMHAFLRDHVLYNKFMNIPNNSPNTQIYNLQMTNLLHMGLQEVLTWNQIKMSKFMGRAMFVYLPTYEIHFHNIDRISSCNHCGYIAREECKNSNISLNHVLNEFLKEKGISQ